jgi:hypothetical protein
VFDAGRAWIIAPTVYRRAVYARNTSGGWCLRHRRSFRRKEVLKIKVSVALRVFTASTKLGIVRSVVIPCYPEEGLLANLLHVLEVVHRVRPDASVHVDWVIRGTEIGFRYGDLGDDIWARLFQTLGPHPPAITHHRKDSDYYDGLFNLEDFEEVITRSPDYVKLANPATKKGVSYKGVMTEGLEAVLRDMRAGDSLVLDQLHHREPKLRLLCRVLAAELGHRFQTNLYLTPASGKGFTPHWDNHDVFILQTVGSKNWNIEKQRRVFPGKNDSIADEDRELRGDLHSFVLEQGDLIYIPSGFVHAAECGSEPSLHITLGFVIVSWEDLLYAAARAAILQDERLRHALPLGFLQAPNDAIVKRLRGAFRELADEAFLRGVVAQYKDELVRTYPLDVSDQIVDFFRPRPLSIDDVLGARRAIVYQMHNGGDSVRINYGARAIVFPTFFREALEFALNRPAYIIREIPGELQDEERIAFAERLLEEGLVVRKEDGQIQ